jgi:ABC-2 type transport system permease protein
MLRDVVRKEIMDNISALKFVVAFVVVVVLIISGLMLGSKNYLEQRGDISKKRLLNQKMLESQYRWLDAGWAGVIETKRPYVLTTIDNGIDNSLGRQASIDTLNEARLDLSRNLISPILAVFGDVDLTFIVRIVLSLFIILLTYDAICGEKERGTLKLALANEVPRYKIILGKILGGYAVIAISFLLPLLIGTAFMMGFYSEILADFSADAWLRLLLIVLVYLLYLAVFFSVGLFVSACCHRSSTSFIVLLMIWVLFVTIIPRVSLSTAERIRPYESYTTLQTKAYKETAERRAEIIKEYLPKLGALQNQMAAREAMGMKGAVPGQEKALSALNTEVWQKITDLQRQAMDRYDREYERQQDTQIALAESISRVLSPASAMSFAVENLAGSGWARQKEYVSQLRSFRKDFMDYIFSNAAAVDLDSLVDLFAKEKLEINPERIKFDFREEVLGAVVARVLWDIAVLAFMALLFFTTAFTAFLKYDVR